MPRVRRSEGADKFWVPPDLTLFLFCSPRTYRISAPVRRAPYPVSRIQVRSRQAPTAAGQRCGELLKLLVAQSRTPAVLWTDLVSAACK